MKFNLKFALFLIFLSLLQVGCASRYVHQEIQDVLPAMSDDQYDANLERNTQSTKRYNGFYNTFEVYVTIKNTQVREALLQRTAHFMRWDRKKAQDEREKSFQEMSTQSHFFIALYTPEREHNDLDMGASMWKAYLDVNGARYPGKIQKYTGKLIDTRGMFPYSTRFHKFYEVRFDVPMTVTETQKSTFELTSSLGQADLTFESIK